MKNRNLSVRRNVRNNKQALVESIMTKIAPIVKRSLNEGVLNDELPEDELPEDELPKDELPYDKFVSWKDKDEENYTKKDYINDFAEQDGKAPIDVPKCSVLYDIINNIGGYTYVINVEYKSANGQHIKSLGELENFSDATYETYYDCSSESIKNALLEIAFNQNVSEFQIGSDHQYTETFEFTRFVREDMELAIQPAIYGIRDIDEKKAHKADKYHSVNENEFKLDDIQIKDIIRNCIIEGHKDFDYIEEFFADLLYFNVKKLYKLWTDVNNEDITR